MKRLTSILLAGLLCMTTNMMSQPAATKEMKSIDQLMDAEIPLLLERNKVPGMAVAIIENGAIIYEKGHGFGDMANQTKISTHTGFNIGSISKLFTAWGIMKLVNDGKLDLDVPVENYLTRWKLPESEFDRSKVTIRAILSHSAGLSVHGYPGFHPDDELPSLEASLNGENRPVRDNETVKVILEPQTQFKYSGGGYTILQLVIEEVTGQKFEIYMQENVFEPLNMSSTSFILDDTILAKSAKPYNELGEEIYLERFTAKAAAGLHTTLEDISAFAKAQFTDNAVLTQETVQEMVTIIPITKTQRVAYGLGYATYSFGPITVTGHSGTNTGWEAGFMMDFEKNDGIILLTNSSNGKKAAFSVLQTWAKWRMK
ncbi:class A beta-lactamase-related serine hydrolase [Fulvivirga sp. RKSG066]|uniref:serine hydrolase domain-containing protein n=1 Tax=Fulvivirga aurantia TaxID=2529383 RepID=UPI0012BD2FFB|nr:serine hydrolase domain-containing protein [Fulvivirga aurantia]MTI22696.1 class A beta-lactamase-related serine hydrolase [Fulvivirga aurantia]